MRYLERVRLLTKYYPLLQGLKKIPLSVWLMLGAAENARWNPDRWAWFYDWWDPATGILLGLPLVFALTWFIDRYYKRSFGSVLPRSATEREEKLGVLLVVTIVFAFILDIGFSPPVTVVGLTIAAWMLWYWRKLGWLATHYVVMSVLLAIVSLLPLAGVISPEKAFDVALPLALGIILVVIGVCDHLILKRALASISKEDDGRAV